MGGVLWSWAVPKGPSLDPADRRMAIHVEDHPVDYAEFQGTIPNGEYGAGSVETWDRGTWQPLEDPDEGMRKGSLRFTLRGKRLAGRFTLARLHRRAPGKPQAWFLIKGHDEHAREGMGAAEIEKEGAALPRRKTARATPAPAPGVVRGALPESQAPQLCTLVDAAPDGEAWLSEVKLMRTPLPLSLGARSFSRAGGCGALRCTEYRLRSPPGWNGVQLRPKLIQHRRDGGRETDGCKPAEPLPCNVERAQTRHTSTQIGKVQSVIRS